MALLLAWAIYSVVKAVLEFILWADLAVQTYFLRRKYMAEKKRKQEQEERAGGSSSSSSRDTPITLMAYKSGTPKSKGRTLEEKIDEIASMQRLFEDARPYFRMLDIIMATKDAVSCVLLPLRTAELLKKFYPGEISFQMAPHGIVQTDQPYFYIKSYEALRCPLFGAITKFQIEKEVAGAVDKFITKVRDEVRLVRIVSTQLVVLALTETEVNLSDYQCNASAILEQFGYETRLFEREINCSEDGTTHRQMMMSVTLKKKDVV